MFTYLSLDIYLQVLKECLQHKYRNTFFKIFDIGKLPLNIYEFGFTKEYNNKMILSVETINKAKHYINHSNERELDLRSKNISEISNLSSTMNYFQAIDLSNNAIKALNNIPYLDRLKTLIMAGNKITEIGNIGEFLPNLQNLFLMNNRVKSIQQVKNLSTCRQLFNLVLNNNPICESMNYRRMVIVEIQSLKQLDFKKIAPKERQQANCQVKS